MSVRTLLLCSRPPWPRVGGDRVRTWHLARALSELGAVDVVTLLPTSEAEEPIRQGLPFVDRWWFPRLKTQQTALRCTAAALQGRSLQLAVYDSPEARACVKEALASSPVADVVVAHLVRTLPWLPSSSPPVVVDIQDALSAAYEGARGKARGWRGVAMRLEQGRIDRAEQAAVERADAVSFISAADREHVLASSGTSPRSVLAGPAIDLEAFPRSAAPRPAGSIGFVGNLRTASNSDMVSYFARSVLPLVRSARPEAELRIVGVEAPAAVRRLGRLPGVRWVGAVEDVADELSRCALTVCPLRFGSGVQNKVLESLAVGTPAVVTPQVAASLGPRAGSALAVAGLDRPFAARIVELLGDEAERTRLSEAGRSFVEQEHQPTVALAPLLELVRELTG